MNTPSKVVYLTDEFAPSTGKKRKGRSARRLLRSTTPATSLDFLKLGESEPIDLVSGGSEDESRWASCRGSDASLAASAAPTTSTTSSSRNSSAGVASSSSVVDLLSGDSDDDGSGEASLALALRLHAEEEHCTEQRRRDEEESTREFLRQEQEQRQRSLQKRRYSCDICMERDVCLESMVTLSCQPVGHRYCRSCFNDYCVSKISDAQVDVDSLVCPSDGCKTAITPHELKANVSADTYEKFERFTLRSVCSANDWKTCPHCSNWFADIPSDDAQVDVWRSVQCQDASCGKTFCGKCGQEPHVKIKHGAVTVTCEEFARLKADTLEDQSLRDLASGAGWRQCPRCRHMSELISGGCKFIYCLCKARFCYLCGVELLQTQHYSHFTGKGCNGPFGSKCLGPEDGVASTQPAAASGSSIFGRIIGNMKNRVRVLK